MTVTDLLCRLLIIPEAGGRQHSHSQKLYESPHQNTMTSTSSKKYQDQYKTQAITLAGMKILITSIIE